MSTGSPASAAGDGAALGPVEDKDSYREVPLFSRNVSSALSKLKLVSSDVVGLRWRDLHRRAVKENVHAIEQVALYRYWVSKNMSRG